MSAFLPYLLGALPGMGSQQAGGFGNFMFGSPGKTDKLPTMNPQQEQLLQQLMSQLGLGGKGGEGGGQIGQGYGQSMQYLTDLLDPESQTFQQFEEPYMKQFEQEIVPGIAERFAGAGGGLGGGLSSSGFGQSLSAAGGQLQSQLASMKGGLQQQAMQSLLGQYGQMSGQALGAQPFGYQYQQPSAGFSQSMLPGAAQAAFGAFGGG